MSTETKVLIIAGIVCVVMLLGGAYIYQATRSTDSVTKNLDALVRSDSKAFGATATSSKLTVVEFGDFECPACGYVAPQFKALMDEPKYKDNVTFVFRDFPLTSIHKNAMKAAQMSYIADEQGKYWDMHNLLYTKQSEWVELANPDDVFIGYAKDLGMDTSGIKAELDSDKYQDRINASEKDGDSLGVDSTPTFFIGDTAGSPIIRVADISAIKSAIDAKLSKSS